jgi:NADPH2:quinone reductase
MHAIGFEVPGPIEVATSLVDFDQAQPVPTGRDLLVEIKAISVNPIDTKVRTRFQPEAGQKKVLGYDASGVVRACGPGATLFKLGDHVYYAGDIRRPGTNAQFHLVDERIVGPKPRTLNFAEAAALPLTTITAWEALFDRIDIRRPVAGGAPAVLIIGGAGGVGSIAVQLARRLTDVKVIATASRPETREWVTALGAHYVVDHAKPMPEQIAALGIGQPSFVFSTTGTGQHITAIAELIAPQGRLGLIDDPPALDIKVLKAKAVSVHWESMFTRSMFETADMIAQHELLKEVAKLVDAGILRTTLTETYGTINAANLKRVHGLIESGTARGKIVLEGF